MKRMVKWMLGAAIAAGGLSLGATTAHAAQIGIVVSGGPVAYVPPSPGPGYRWVPGYWNFGVWIPGRWAFVGAQYYDRDDFRYGVYYRGGNWDNDGWRNRDGEDYRWRNRDRDDYRFRDRDGDRFRGGDRDRYRDRDRNRDRDGDQRRFHEGFRDRR